MFLKRVLGKPSHPWGEQKSSAPPPAIVQALAKLNRVNKVHNEEQLERLHRKLVSSLKFALQDLLTRSSPDLWISDCESTLRAISGELRRTRATAESRDLVEAALTSMRVLSWESDLYNNDVRLAAIEVVEVLLSQFTDRILT
jgi:hypothetical protein